MRILSLCLAIFSLVGCASTGSNGYPGPRAAHVSYTAVDNSRMLNTGVDVQAINRAIRASDGPYWAPEEEVFQQSLDDDFL